jgi:hypothetical protein
MSISSKRDRSGSTRYDPLRLHRMLRGRMPGTAGLLNLKTKNERCISDLLLSRWIRQDQSTSMAGGPREKANKDFLIARTL